MSTINLLEQIKDDKIVLPSIQRDFVWPEAKIEKLLDSIMRGYPIGILLLWETYNDIQYRFFSKDYRSDDQHTFHDNNLNKGLKLVLDGQQRLQSLYISIFGTYEGKYLYFGIRFKFKGNWHYFKSKSNTTSRLVTIPRLTK